MLATSTLPSISISLAPPPEPFPEPYSPFKNKFFPTAEPDSPRPTMLLPPPSNHVPGFGNSSARGNANGNGATVFGKGLERSMFDAMLRTSRQRAGLSSPVVGPQHHHQPGASGYPYQKPVELRKEIAIKATQNKQLQRRALFLSRTAAPPSPTATITPATPPESPAVFHFSLPSPGLVSPLALFETVVADDSPREKWVERVDFREAKLDLSSDEDDEPAVPVVRQKHERKSSIPSLEQISAKLSRDRMNGVGGPVITITRDHHEDSVTEDGAAPKPGRLPAFLSRPRSTSPPLHLNTNAPPLSPSLTGSGSISPVSSSFTASTDGTVSPIAPRIRVSTSGGGAVAILVPPTPLPTKPAEIPVIKPAQTLPLPIGTGRPLPGSGSGSKPSLAALPIGVHRGPSPIPIPQSATKVQSVPPPQPRVVTGPAVVGPRLSSQPGFGYGYGKGGKPWHHMNLPPRMIALQQTQPPANGSTAAAPRPQPQLRLKHHSMSLAMTPAVEKRGDRKERANAMLEAISKRRISAPCRIGR